LEGPDEKFSDGSFLGTDGNWTHMNVIRR